MPKRTPKKSSKDSRKASAKKAAATRARNKAKKSAAAKKGWRTRRRNARKNTWVVEFTYSGHTTGNGYRMVIFIRPRKKLSSDDVIDLAFTLVKSGHFNYQEPIDPDSDYDGDYSWIFPTQDSAEKLTGKQTMKEGRARLYGFYRD